MWRTNFCGWQVKKLRISWVYFCHWLIHRQFGGIDIRDGPIWKVTRKINYNMIRLKDTTLFNKNLLNYHLVHIKGCLYNYVTKRWFYLSIFNLYCTAVQSEQTFNIEKKKRISWNKFSRLNQFINFSGI